MTPQGHVDHSHLALDGKTNRRFHSLLVHAAEDSLRQRIARLSDQCEYYRRLYYRVVSQNSLTRSVATIAAEHRDIATTCFRGSTGRTAIVAQGSFDAVQDLAQVLPQSIVPDFIGLPQEGREHMLEWAEATFNAMGPMNERCMHALQIVPEVFAYARQITTSGNLQPGSFAAGVLEAERDGRITEAQCPQLLTAYLVPSLDTTISAVGSAIWLFGRHPDQWDHVRANPSLIANAFEELLRLESPIQGFSRMATNDYNMDGLSIPAGSRIIVLFASANRDERKWQHADTFDVTRNTSGHLGFGYGVHLCAGASLARLEGHAVLRALAQRVERFQPGTSIRKLNNIIRGFSSLNVS